MDAARVLLVATGTRTLADGRPAGFWLPEAAYPWTGLTAAGWAVDLVVARATGRQVPDDGPLASGVDRADPVQRAFLADPAARRALSRATPVGRRDPARYAAVVYAGGYGAVFDMPHDEALASFASAVAAGGGWLWAVCHGPAGLLPLRTEAGRPLVAGRRVAAFTVEEEDASDMRGVVPLLLPDALGALGARMSAGPAFRSHVVRDGRLITGQNPASAPAAARELVDALGPAPGRAALRRAASVARSTGRTAPRARQPRRGPADTEMATPAGSARGGRS
ncbi:MAG: type 1 glutamine amidotransferase domain-containing protein [Dermatophilaceae bacterium]